MDLDHQSLEAIAARLGKSPRWLQSRLTGRISRAPKPAKLGPT
jgi:hypothetical protein